MPANIVTSATPEEREIEKKQRELKSLETDLVQSELQLATLQAELRAFQARYFHALGSRFVELDSIEAEIAERQARRHPADAAARERAEQAREPSAPCVFRPPSGGLRLPRPGRGPLKGAMSRSRRRPPSPEGLGWWKTPPIRGGASPETLNAAGARK